MYHDSVLFKMFCCVLCGFCFDIRKRNKKKQMKMKQAEKNRLIELKLSENPWQFNY